MQKGNVIQYRVDITADKSYKNYFCSDLHIDSIHFDKNRLQSELEQAIEQNATIHIFGDIFDGINQKRDPRHEKKLTQNAFKGAYFNDIVKHVYKFLEPYMPFIGVLGYGNHETAVLRHNEIDLIDMLYKEAIVHGYKNVYKGAYRGFIIYRFETSKKIRTKTLYYYHGKGGGGKSDGIIKTQDRISYIEADIYVTGHIHQSFVREPRRVYVSKSLDIIRKKLDVIQLGTFQTDITDGLDFADVNDFRPPVIGGKFIEFYIARDGSLDTIITNPKI